MSPASVAVANRCPLCSSPVPPSAASCPTCGAPLNGAAASGGTGTGLQDVLPPSTRLNGGNLSVGRVLGRGGFGITYLGADLLLKRAVAIKEFFPAGSTRKGTAVVFPTTLSRSEYELAMQKFTQEAQMLARFRHTSIVNVYTVFRENDSAYMVMEYLQGENLLERMERRGGPLEEADMIAITAPIAEALTEVHAAGILHRDIKPENIMIVERDSAMRPVLIDFGAAREFASGMVNRHSIVLTPGYAPLEQYGEQARRGPFTDVYALAATLYHVGTGEQPPAATERALGVALKAPRSLNPALSPQFDAALVHGMEMKVAERPQTATQFYEELSGGAPAHTAPAAPGLAPFAEPPPTPPPPTPAPPPPSPAVPSTGTHIDRVRQIAREITAGGAIQTDHFLCPVCRSANMLDAAGTVAGTRCPVCRAAVLKERFTGSDKLLCPSCSAGTLQAVAAAEVQPQAMMRCPACRAGSVVTYVRPQMLFVPDLWARCDNCGADFDYHAQTDSLTLEELPGGPGYLSAQSIGETRTRREWAEMAGEVTAGYACPVCQSEFQNCDDGGFEWISRSGDPLAVPAEYQGRCLSSATWTKLAHHLPQTEGSVACPHCDAQFDETDGAQLTLLGAPRDPHGTVAANRGQSYPASTWRAMATGRKRATTAGLVCPSCAAEVQESRGRKGYALAWYDQVRDAYGTGRRYGRETLSADDWRRIASGGVPRSEERDLREEALKEFWAAMRTGEVSTSTAEDSFPESRLPDEKAVITFPAVQIRSRFGFLYERDGGQVWLSTRRLLYVGDRGTIVVSHGEAGEAAVVDVGGGYTPVVHIRGRDRSDLFRFIMGSGPIGYNVDGLALQIPWDERAFVSLYESLRRLA